MPGIYVGERATKVTLIGYGVEVKQAIEIAPLLSLGPPAYSIAAEELRDRVRGDLERAAILSMGGLSTFSLEVAAAGDAKGLAIRAWNSLWLFGLMSLACNFPCKPLFAFSNEPDARYSLVNRNLSIRPIGNEPAIQSHEVDWVRQNYDRYHALIADERFSASVRAYNNAHYLFDLDQRLMLLWAGIEGLLEVEGELRRRIALHAAILSDSAKDEKVRLFHQTKRAYDFRSKVVHGAKSDPKRMTAEYKFASQLLVGLLRKCVQIGRVPTAREIDEAALTASIV